MPELAIYGLNLVKQFQLFSEKGTTTWGMKARKF